MMIIFVSRPLIVKYISEEFKEKASTIFEAAVAAKVKGIEKQLEEEKVFCKQYID